MKTTGYCIRWSPLIPPSPLLPGHACPGIPHCPRWDMGQPLAGCSPDVPRGTAARLPAVGLAAGRLARRKPALRPGPLGVRDLRAQVDDGGTVIMTRVSCLTRYHLAALKIFKRT